MTAIAIIPARGGSKRIPRKNIRPFLGKPILTYGIVAAIESGLFDEVMVSTDDDEIAAVARQYGASVPFRRNAQTANDYATTADVLTEVLGQYEGLGQSFDLACCLYPTAPFVTADLLQRAITLLTDRQFDTVYPVQQFSFAVQRAVTLRDDRVAWLNPEHALTRSQDLEPAYHDAGQCYVFRPDVLRATGKLITSNSGGLLIPELHAHDIDTEDDWQIAEFKYRLMHGL
ncbi:pseudaminic acid cytidylyltransferase [Spirosoma rhododendri]|uniref:Pseudaminic acid cytidylyltransferase n=1 Tax=Spirosoma rhododendri TaxID=2728024 RepID=A0A7L5DGT1_9BACT|nr:pseudaminic acid cytidylyltransferase [Spirosoma rhododendri]QJD77474.1 pseudaminic acid cytidylyltransferase [Spirosoma rhododendri]